jgi:hypothetical protein
MNNLIADILRSLPNGTTLSTALMVADYILCTTPVSPSEEGEVLTHVLDINQLLGKDWHPVFNNEIVSLALEGKVKAKTGELVDKGVAVTHKQLCSKRAAIYGEKEPSIVTMADSVRSSLLAAAAPTA